MFFGPSLLIMPCGPWVGKAVRGSVHDLGNHRQCTDGPGADAGGQKQLREVTWPTGGRRCKVSLEPFDHHVARPNIMMSRQFKIMVGGWAKAQQICKSAAAIPAKLDDTL